MRQQAIAHLNEFNLSTTLVVTLKKGLNDGEIGKIIDFALKQRCVRGVTFQPVVLPTSALCTRRVHLLKHLSDYDCAIYGRLQL